METLPNAASPDAPEANRDPGLREEARRILAGWEGVLKPQGFPPYFEGVEAMPPPDPTTTEFNLANAWLCAELSRLVYTPDHREALRPWNRYIRKDYLKRAYLREVHSVHKTGCHAGVFVCDHPELEKPFSILCFRGTNKVRQWVLNLTPKHVPWEADDPESPQVHQGFKILFDRVWPQLASALDDVPGPLFYTGHSLGAALACMAAVRRAPFVLYTFGCPRAGNGTFCEMLKDVPHHRIVHRHDIVTLVPDSSERVAPFDYHHCPDFWYLGGPGEILRTPPLEALGEDDESWRPDQPLQFLADSFRTPYPPECVRDHSPIHYVKKLHALAVAGVDVPTAPSR